MSEIAEVEESSPPAGIEYMGVGGSTAACVEAIETILQSGRKFAEALVLTQRDNLVGCHAIIFRDVYDGQLAIKSGFSSGYGGTGPAGLSKVITLINWWDIDLDEIVVGEEFIKRLDDSSLTQRDLANVREARRVRPKRVWDYVDNVDSERWLEGNPWHSSRVQIPFALIDQRLLRFAKDFWGDPDGFLLKAHRNLEVIIAERAKVSTEDKSKGSAKVFAAAFNGEDAPLRWPGLPQGEIDGRSNLFIGTAKAYRNARAHRDDPANSHDLMAEFLLLNHLYRLESTAICRA